MLNLSNEPSLTGILLLLFGEVLTLQHAQIMKSNDMRIISNFPFWFNSKHPNKRLFFISILGFISMFWLPIYIGLYKGWWMIVLSYIFIHVIWAPIMSKLLKSFLLFSIGFTFLPIIIPIGLFLTIMTLL